MTNKKAHKILFISVLLTLVIVGFGVVAVASPTFRDQDLQGYGQTVFAHLHSSPQQPFPNIDTTNLTALQAKVITVSHTEYDKKPVSFNATVLKYSAGSKESWCADYVSWVLMQAGQPLSNPNSDGGWRIPGTATMQAYYQSSNRYVAAGSYTPRVGDVAIYRHNRSHVNIVIAVHGNQMITIGGNETGHLRLNTQTYSFGSQGLSGFGQPSSSSLTHRNL